MEFLLWIIAVILVIAGITTILRRQVLYDRPHRPRLLGRPRRREHPHLDPPPTSGVPVRIVLLLLALVSLGLGAVPRTIARTPRRP